MKRVAWIVGGVVLALGLAGCRSAPQPRAPRVCKDLANAFYVIASQRDRGVTRAEQLEAAQASLGERESEEALSGWRRLIDLVYRFDDATAEEIGWTILDGCVVNRRGQAVVTTLWPTSVGRAPDRGDFAPSHSAGD